MLKQVLHFFASLLRTTVLWRYTRVETLEERCRMVCAYCCEGIIIGNIALNASMHLGVSICGRHRHHCLMKSEFAVVGATFCLFNDKH